MEIQYRRSDGTLGSIDSKTLKEINVDPKTNKLTIKQIFYGWDEYDYWFGEIEDVIEIRV